MPTLALLAACERSIIEADTKAVSLITMFTGVRVTVPAEEPPPVNAVTPKDWAIVAGWDAGEGEEGREFVQCLEIFLPDGKLFAEKNQVKFTLERNKRHHNTSRLLGFPVGQIGKCQVQIWAELDGKPVTEKFSLYLGVEHEIVGRSK